MDEKDLHNLVVDFGKHKGELWTRVPLSYLRWLINEKTKWSDIAFAELKRRGSTKLPELELSGHAIDRASQRLMKFWRGQEQGLYSWLHDIAVEAFENGEVIDETDKNKKVEYKEIKFKFAKGEIYPTLLTVFKK